jgi:hypothetical protein
MYAATVSLVALVATALASGVTAQTVTRDQFLEELKATHPVFVSHRMTADIESEDRNSYLGAEDWLVRSAFGITHSEAAFAGLGPEKTTGISLSGDVQRTFWSTGGRLSGSLSFYRGDLTVDPAFGIPDSYYETQLGVVYSHPLMKNKGGYLDRLAYDLKQYDIDYSEIEAVETEEDFLAAAASRFLDWVFLTEQRDITLERLSLSEQELERTNRKREAYLVDQADVIRAEDAVRFWEQTLELVGVDWAAVQAELAVLAQADTLFHVEPAFDLYVLEPLPSLEDSVEHLKAHSRLLSAPRVRVEQLQHARLGYEETAKPDLTLVAELNAKGAADPFFDTLTPDRPGGALGLEFGFPVENRTANSQIARTDLEIEQLELVIDEVSLTLASALANVHTQLREFEQVLALNVEQIESAKLRTEEEHKLYNQGRGELTFVIQSRDNEQLAHLTYAANALAYHKLLVEYRSLADQLHERAE